MAEEKTIDLEELKRRVFVAEAHRKLAESDLPDYLRKRIAKKVDAGKVATEEALEEEIREAKEIYEELRGSVKGRDFAEPPTTQGTSREELYHGLVGLISGKDSEGHKRFRSLREAYWHWAQSQGRPVDMFSTLDVARSILKEAGRTFDPLTLRSDINEAMAGGYNILESITSSSFATLLGAAMHKVFLDQYRDMEERFGDWQRIVSHRMVVSDFKEHNFTRRGLYNSLPSVAQGGTYQNLTTPGEENVKLQVVKYGGLEDLTLEAIANDDLNALQSIPRDLATAAAIGRYRAVFDLFTANSGNGVAMDYDNVNLFAAGHNNLGSTALSNDSLHSAAMTMLSNSALGASEATLFARPRYILVPKDLYMLAWQLYNSDWEVDAGTGSINNPNPVKGLAEPIVVPYWTDANNWYLVADPETNPTIAVAFLEGHETPMVVQQDDPAVGSVFNADKITYKVRDVRDQDVLDHRSFFGAVVV